GDGTGYRRKPIMSRKTAVQRIAEKLHPKRFRVSPRFHAVLACLLNQSGWTTPEIAALTVTSDGFLLGRARGDIGYNHILGTRSDLERNIIGASAAAGLTASETRRLLALCPSLSASFVNLHRQPPNIAVQHVGPVPRESRIELGRGPCAVKVRQVNSN